MTPEQKAQPHIPQALKDQRAAVSAAILAIATGTPHAPTNTLPDQSAGEVVRKGAKYDSSKGADGQTRLVAKKALRVDPKTGATVLAPAKKAAPKKAAKPKAPAKSRIVERVPAETIRGLLAGHDVSQKELAGLMGRSPALVGGWLGRGGQTRGTPGHEHPTNPLLAADRLAGVTKAVEAFAAKREADEAKAALKAE